ncbi:SAG family member [Eimeria brunetti]|uniref:SAG family member n=1 Tax=Eimeria brunetti TaxID=51314 RepID=U6LAT5_9EIME|nr:SAG family member [Eimeria brunetti]
MAPSKIFFFVGTLLAVGSATPSYAAEPTYEVELGSEGECLTQIDAAREAAGLAKFATPSEENKKLPLATTNAAWAPLCKDLINASSPKSVREIQDFEEGTYAFEVLKSAKVDCDAAVDLWKGAYKNFSGLPPAGNKDTANIYKDKVNVSLVALFNPKSGATADCRVATCTEIPGAEERSIVNAEEQHRKAFIFVCMTTPDVLKSDEPPFTQDEWDKISSAITGSAAVAFPGFILVAMSVLSIAIL